MGNKLWFKGGKLLADQNGRPYLCGKCPCDKNDTYYVGYFCLCSGSAETSKLVGPSSYGIYTRSFLANNGYLEFYEGNAYVGTPCKNDRIFHPVGEGLTTSQTGHSYAWAQNALNQHRASSLAAAEECVRTCISEAHYHKNADTAGGLYNTIKLDFDGYTFDLKLTSNDSGISDGPIFSYTNGSKFYKIISTFATGSDYRIYHKDAEDEDAFYSEFLVAATFSWAYGINTSKYWMLDGTVEVYTNRFRLDVKIRRRRVLKDFTVEEDIIMPHYEVLNCTDDALYTEEGEPAGDGGGITLGQEFPAILSDLTIEQGEMHEKPESVNDIKEPDWYNIYSMVADKVIGFYFHWATDSSSGYLNDGSEAPMLRIYDPGYQYIYYPDGCGGPYYYPNDGVPDEFE